MKNTSSKEKKSKIGVLCLLALITTLTLPSSIRGSKILYKMGDVTKGDRRFIYPSREMKHKPIGGFLKDIPQIKIEPRIEFLRSHDEKCKHGKRGHFESHNQAFFYCGDKKVEISNPTKAGQRESFTISEAPIESDVLFMLPLGGTNEVAIITKLTSTKGHYEIYLKSKKLGYKFEPETTDAAYQEASNLRAFIPAKNSKKDGKEIYFYAVGSTNVYQFKLDASDSKSATTKIDLKTEIKDKHEKLSKVENFLVSESYITFAGYEDGQSFIFTCPASPTETNQLKTCVKEEVYKVSKDTRVWGYREKQEYMNVVIWHKDTTNSKLTVKIGYFVSSKEETRNKLGEYTIDNSHIEGKTGVEIDDVHFQDNYVRLSFRDKDHVLSIWNVWSHSTKEAQRTKASLPAGITSLVFMAPDYYIGVRAHFEYNFNFLNFVFDPSNLQAEKFQHDIVCSKSDGTHVDYDFQANIVKPTDVKFAASTNSKSVKIKAVKNTLVEYNLPELNFRGNNLMYSITSEKSDKVNLMAEKYFNVISDKEDKIEILDDLFGQSIKGNGFSIHSCELDVDVSLKANCKRIGEEVKYTGAKESELKILAQVNNIEGIFTVFEGKDSKLGLGIYYKAKSVLEPISEIDVKNDLGGDGIPDFVTLGTLKKIVYLYIAKDTKMIKMNFKQGSGQTKDIYDIKDLIPTSKGKVCKAESLKMANFYDEKHELTHRSFVTYNCGAENVIVDMRSRSDMREILNYENKKVKTCVTKAGIIHADITSTEQHMAYMIRSENGERIDYEFSSFDVKTVNNLICDHPGEGHILVQGKNKAGKDVILMLNLQKTDPLDLIYTRFDDPYSPSKAIQSSRFNQYFIFTFTDSSGNKKYLLVNTMDKELLIKADDNFKIEFRAGIYNQPKSDNDFTVAITVETTTVPETKIIQRPNKFSDFDKKGIYDLDDFFVPTGPANEFKVDIPESLSKDKKVVSLFEGKRTVIEDNKKDVNFPSSQEMSLEYADGRYVIMRSNEYETEVHEIITSTSPATTNKIFEIEESCMKMSFSARNGQGTIYLSCPNSNDVIIHIKIEGDKIVEDGFKFLPPSTKSSVVHLDKRLAVVAKTFRRGTSKVTFKFEPFEVPEKSKGGKEYLEPKFQYEIEESKK